MASSISKIQEFIAHGDPVNCVTFGRKTGALFATGGDDRKLNVWSVGKPNVLLSLSGNSSGVESVQFDVQEEVVVGGLASGGLRLWDLAQGKMVRTLAGHTSNVRTIDFHPYGEFVASGSLDTTLKIWDIKRKGCIQTYKGHTDVINCIRFSPDGRWIVSGSDDSTVKLWDVTAGKLLNEFKAHTGPVTWIEFHPNEFLLATASADRTVKLLDLETFKTVSSSTPDVSRVRCTSFLPSGEALVSATQDTMRVVGWEPHVLLDSVSIQWGRVCDMHAPTTKSMLAAALNGNNVTVWNIDLEAINLDRKKALDPDRVSAPPPRPVTAVEPRLPPAAAAAAVSAPPPSKPVEAPTPLAAPARLPPAAAAAAAPSAPKRTETVSPPLEPSAPAPPRARLEPESFLPPKAAVGSSPADVLNNILTDHGSTLMALSRRLKQVKIVRASWGQSHRRALEQLHELGDVAAMADVLNVLVLKPALWSLEIACAAVPAVEALLYSRQESFVICGCTAATLIVRLFCQVVVSNIQAPPPRGAADLTREERYERCQTLFSFFSNLKSGVGAGRIGARESSGKAGAAVRKLAGVLEDI